MKIIRLTPLDTFFFRDARSFQAGEDAWAEGVFPPPPSVLYGALASAFYASQNDFSLSDNTEVNNRQREMLKNFRITGIFISVYDGKIVLPVPRDVVKLKDEDKNNLMYLERKPNTLVSSLQTEEMLFSPQQSETASGYVDDNTYKKILLRENLDNPSYYSDIVITEGKTGIGREKLTYTAQEGELYTMNMYRFNTDKYKKCQIVVTCEGLELPEKGITRLGSKKCFSYTTEDMGITTDKFIPSPPKEDMKENIFRLCLSTPCIFQKGWIPHWLDENTLEGNVPGTDLRLKLVTAAIGKPTLLGGFNMKAKNGKGFPKPMCRMVPEGSVYYFRILEGTYEEVIQKFHFKSVSEKSPSKEENSTTDNTAKKGFGIAFIGI
ncbi:MAG: type III-B CRISPR module-associated protein Cmr3 [Bacteroidia bacterium]|nr:type III-B CRISPR module-associated protein Cmr3 [Bacteroidia bacterium]MDW8345846.1 type III-B CRISPR module-associated protein Cmr3 [Bacteroidia bacterium]